MRGSPLQHLETLLATTLDSKRPLRVSDLAEFSDLDREEAESFVKHWTRADAKRRREVVLRMAELAEDNFDLNFDRVFLMALGDPDGGVRLHAAAGLAQSEDSSVIAPLVRVLTGDALEEVRVAAAHTLGKFVLLGELDKVSATETARARDALLTILDNPAAGAELRRRALEAIAPWTSPRVTVLIDEAYHSKDKLVRAAAVYAMGMNCDTRWLPVLFSELSSTDARLRFEAAHAVGEIADERGVPHLVPLLQDEDVEVRLAVVWALGQIGGKAAKEALKKHRNDPDERIKEAVEEALTEASLGDDVISL